MLLAGKNALVSGASRGIGAAIVTGVVSWIAAALFGEGERAR